MLNLKDIIIDPEFRDFLPSVDDATLLRGKIELEGWSDEPITVWMPHAILLDGHRRYAIWQERRDDGPQVREMKFATREAAFYWVVNNQRARRNLTPQQEDYLLGRKYTAEVGIGGAPKGNQNAKKQPDTNCQVVLAKPTTNPTRAKIAAESGVSQGKVAQSVNYANAVDDLDKRGVVSKAELLSGEVKVPKSKVIEASKAENNDEAKAMLTKPKKEDKPKENKVDPRGLPRAENTPVESKLALQSIQNAVALLEKMKLATLQESDATVISDGIRKIRTRLYRILTSLKGHSNGQDTTEEDQN